MVETKIISKHERKLKRVKLKVHADPEADTFNKEVHVRKKSLLKSPSQLSKDIMKSSGQLT